jgi:hypothetical protein
MASAAILRNELPRYHLISADGDHIVLRQAADGAAGSRTVVEFALGGQQGGAAVRLTQANVTDILTALTNFASTGTLA